MRELVKIFKALSDSNRIRILKMLEVRPLTVCEITRVLNLATSTVSKHLSLLRDVDLILDSKEGKWVIYRLNQSKKDRYVSQLLPLINEWVDDDPQVREDQKEITDSDRESACNI